MARIVVLLALVSSGCASTLSTLQTAETTPKGHAELHAGLGAYAPLGALPHLVKAGELETKGVQSLASTGSHPTPPVQERDELLDAALSLMLQTPGPVWEVGARFGLTDFWDIGARVSSNDWSADTKLRLFKRTLSSDVSHSAALDFRYCNVDVSNPVVDVLDFVNMGDFSRYDLELTGLYTLNVRDVVRLYGGPKIVRTSFHFDENAFKFGNDANAYAGLPPLVGSIDDHMFFYGGVAGISGTYKRVSLYLELDGGWTHLAPEILGEKRDLSGVTLYPAIGLAVSI